MPPELSLVVLAHNGLDLTRRCVESLVATTDVPYELVLVDNGSSDGTAQWIETTGHRAILHSNNLGFAAGMNSGLHAAAGDYVAFVNNDTVFPAGWARTALSAFEAVPTAGIVAPAVTAAGNPATVRSQPGDGVRIFEPFGHLPSGVVYVMRTEVMRRLGGWNEDYLVATGEDLDLLWTVWANGLDVVLDERVLIEHVSEATRRTLGDMETIRKRNLAQFLDRWEASTPSPPRLVECPTEAFESNLRHAAAGAIWLRRLVEAREAVRTELEAVRAASRAAPPASPTPRRLFRR